MESQSDSITVTGIQARRAIESVSVECAKVQRKGFVGAFKNARLTTASLCSKRSSRIIVECNKTENRVLKIGDRVRGAKGRDSEKWHGRITGLIMSCADGTPYYSVYWDERANSSEALISKCPEIGMRADQLRYRH